MRFLPIFLVLAALLPCIAVASQPVPGLPTPVSASAAAAKPTPTIIPGSPLATLAGVSPSASTPIPPPFGTGKLGFAFSSVLGHETAHTFDDFTNALWRSTRLTPVFAWLKSFSASGTRQAAVHLFQGLASAFLPGVALDLAFRFLLSKPMALCAQRASKKRPESSRTPDQPAAYAPMHMTFRRLGFALLKFGLTLLPIAAFAVTEQSLLSSGLITIRSARLAVTGVANAYLLARLSQEAMRLLLSPQVPSLRLLRLSTSYAAWGMHRAMTLIATIFCAYFVISIGELLGLSKDGAGALIRLAALIVHLEVALGIWQSRHVISRWIAGKPDAEGFIAGLRQRFAEIWYAITLFYVLALWVAWAGGVHNALGVLLRAILVVMTALLFGRLAWSGSSVLLARIFPDQETEASRASFLIRVRSYNPLIRLLVRATIALLVLLLVFQGWGLNTFDWLLSNTISRALLSVAGSVVITIAIAITIWEFINFQLERRVEKLNNAGRTRPAARLRTLSPMLQAGFGVILVVVTLLVVLSRIGLNTTGLLAVSSVVGIAVGFGSQKLVQDIITGLFLLFEDAVQVGDVVTLGGMSGTVERLSIRTIRLRGGDGSINIIPFSSVTTVTNQTRDFSYAQISIMVGLREDIEQVTAVLKDIGTQMRTEPTWAEMMRDDLQLFGLDSFNDLGLVLTGQIRTGPGQHWAVRREFYGRVQKRFTEEGIELPSRNQTLQLSFPATELERLLSTTKAKPVSAKSVSGI
ncbi:mechanosensitive ion channel family protein [Acidocella sp.]|uniref:mechanosensitive ion channel family protein n=1 Tax=Acidocella sp. TaxID=50710 RepID=UPI00262DC459|nr:mechanosensitive ion channel family protein [Acidocella sp.]